MLNEVDDGVLHVRRRDFMTQTVHYSLSPRTQRMCRMLNEIADGVLLVRLGNFMTQTIRYMRPHSL